MIVAGYKHEAINRMGARLRATLTRCDPPIPDSLRLMAVQIVKEGILRGLQGHTEIYPGMKKFAKWGGCSERQARRNVRALENWGLLTEVSHGKGGRHSTRYWVEPENMIRAAMAMDANPHPDLIAEIRDMRADMRADIHPGHEAGHMSAGSYDTTPAASPSRVPVSRGPKITSGCTIGETWDLLRIGRANGAASASPSKQSTPAKKKSPMNGTPTC